jgi:ABC-2 type transport system ATP-binding protein
VIEASGLSKRYGATLAVDDLSFTVPPGQVTGFLGPNGAGKSTTMRLILGLDAPSAGTVTVNGRRYACYPRPLFEVGALLEAKATHPGRSAANHLRWLARSNGIGAARVEQVLEQVGLASAAGRRVGGFSLGMAQRLGIAVALLGDPPVLILDEPVNGLDPEGVLWVRNLVKALAAEGRTVFLSSHLMSEMAITADRLIIIGQGRLIAETSVAELLASGTGSYVQVRTPQADTLTTALRARGATVTRAAADTLQARGIEPDVVGELAREAGITLIELSTQHASLEQRYMELTGEALDYRTAPGDRPEQDIQVSRR